MFFFLFIIFFLLGLYFMMTYSLIFELFFSYSDYMDFSFVFLFDYVSFFFFSFVSLISSVVFLYSKFYMSDFSFIFILDNNRFFYLLFLFVMSMFFLVFSGSWVVVLFGWDGLGLVSFLLVIYYNSPSSLDSGLLTVFTNRIGDGFFILSFIFLFYSGWLFFDFLQLFSSSFIILIIVLGCFTKSAQIPFSSWLPAAMAAPTPVSSLVHSSTLVTAGVYLIIRFNFLFLPLFYFMSFLSLFTMFLAGFCALYEKDLKKVVAMSTLSQLGFMIFSLSLGLWLFSFLHMIFHAFFKSSLFLSTGSLMHNLFGNQDSRYFGSFGSSYFSKVFFITSCISLMGFPFSLGFYSKDLIIGCLLFYGFDLYFILFMLSCVFTVGYSFRLIFSSFFFVPSFSTMISFTESFYFFLPVLFLYFFCVFFGNFFFFFFTSPFLFSFLECSMGIFFIIVGFFFYFYLDNFFFFDFFSCNVGLLTFLSIPILSSFYSKFSFIMDYSWFELCGGQGVKLFFFYVLHKGFVFFFLSFVFSIFFFFFF